MSARVQGRYPGETLPLVEGGTLWEAGMDSSLLSNSQTCWHADLRQDGRSDQLGGHRSSAQGSPGSRLCCAGSSCPPQSLILDQWVPTLRQGCHRGPSSSVAACFRAIYSLLRGPVAWFLSSSMTLPSCQTSYTLAVKGGNNKCPATQRPEKGPLSFAH